jgi:ABC-2 type transport system permease protein
MTTVVIPRASSASARPSGGLARMLYHQARSELVKLLRAPDFVAGAVLLPAVLFVLFGARAIGSTLPNGIALGPFVVAAFTAYGLLGVVLFTFGESLAHERGQGWLRLSRATPLPAGVFLAGKLVAGLAIALIFVVIMAVTATLLGAGIQVGTWVSMAGLGIVGALSLTPIGFLIGFLVRPSAAGATALLLYLPLSFASGMWMPVNELPEPVQAVSPYLPTHHFASLVQTAVTGASPWEHIIWLIATFVIAGGAAVIAYRRMVGRQFA